MTLEGKLGVLKDIGTCSLDKILKSVLQPLPASTAQQTTRLPFQMTGLVLGSAQQQRLGMQLQGSGGPTVWFVDPLVAAEIVASPTLKITPLGWPIVAELPVGMRVVLKATAYVADGTRIVIRGAQNTIVPHTNQLIVQPRGMLELSNLTVTGSINTPAIKLLGRALLTDIVMKKNGFLSPNKRDLNNPVSGAALTLMINSYCRAVSTKFVGNDAGLHLSGAQGGAIALNQKCTFECHDCEISENLANKGAGLSILDGGNAKFTGTTVWNDNVASDGGGVLMIIRSGSMTQEGALHVSRNQAMGNTGAAIAHIFVGGTIRLENAHLLNNRGTSYMARGGAFGIDKEGSIHCKNCTIDGSEAGQDGERRQDEAYGGVIWQV